MEFSNSLNDLIDISHQNAFKIITRNEDKPFLIKQWEEERTGSMVNIDRKRTVIEERKLERLEKEEKNRICT